MAEDVTDERLGIVQHHRWRPEPGANVDDYEVPGWSVLGRKP